MPSASLEKATSHGRSCSLLSYTCVVFNSCRAAATSFTLPSRAWQKKNTFSDQTRVEGMILYKRPSSLCSCYFTSHSSRALWARVWLVGCFHWFSCFFCCSIQPWRHCKRLSLSAQVRWICSAPQIWWEKAKRWMNHDKQKSHEKLCLYSRVRVKKCIFLFLLL